MQKLVPCLGVSDLRRSVGFYRELLGFEPVDSIEDAGGAPLWVWLRSGVAELMLQQLDAEAQVTLEPALGQSWTIYLRPADLHGTRARLAAAGVEVSEVQTTAYGAEECFARDPDGYELWLSVPDSGRGPDDDEDEDGLGADGDGDPPDDPDEGELEHPGRSDEDRADADDPDEGELEDPGRRGEDEDDLPDEGGRTSGSGDRLH